jgi:hypothetical protein
MKEQTQQKQQDLAVLAAFAVQSCFNKWGSSNWGHQIQPLACRNSLLCDAWSHGASHTLLSMNNYRARLHNVSCLREKPSSQRHRNRRIVSSVWQATKGNFLLSLSILESTTATKLPLRDTVLVFVGVFGDRRQHFGSRHRFDSMLTNRR